MNTSAAIVELIVATRERGGDEDPRLRRLVASLERHAVKMRERNSRRARFRYECLRCQAWNRRGLLCHGCAAEAPAAVRDAFANMKGHPLDAMRKATELVRRWVRGEKQTRRKAA